MKATIYHTSRDENLGVKLIWKDKKGNIESEFIADFTGGRFVKDEDDVFKPGIFITSNERVIKKLDKHPYIENGRIVKFQEGDKEISQEFETDEAPNEDTETQEEENIEEATPSVLEEVTGHDTVQEASKYLRDRFDDLVARDVNTKAKVFKVANERGIMFTDLD